MNIDYFKVRQGKRWLLCKPILGDEGALRTIATFDAEPEIDAVLALLRMQGAQAGKRAA